MLSSSLGEEKEPPFVLSVCQERYCFIQRWDLFSLMANNSCSWDCNSVEFYLNPSIKRMIFWSLFFFIIIIKEIHGLFSPSCDCFLKVLTNFQVQVTSRVLEFFQQLRLQDLNCSKVKLKNSINLHIIYQNAQFWEYSWGVFFYPHTVSLALAGVCPAQDHSTVISRL